jgi:hypothetical protein
MVRELGSFCIALGLVHPLANCKLLATPAHRLCAEIHVRALRILGDIGSIAKNQKFPNFICAQNLQITHSVNPAND